MGDPAGLGPELLFSADLENISSKHPLLIIGPENILDYHAQNFGRSRFWKRIDNPRSIKDADPGIYLFQPPSIDGQTYIPGRGDSSGGFAAGTSLNLACGLLEKDFAQALVTGPLNKAFMLDAGFAFGGHTEFLADYFKVPDENICMHLCGKRLRVSLVTTHPPLRLVPDLITQDKIIHCLKLTKNFMDQSGFTAPVAVCGLNPHAGEQGKIGNEEQTIIIPAIERARQLSIDAQGPFPADTVFARAFKGEFSAVLAMYHDQGLGPLKLIEFGQSVNVTLGLPIIRTSVDHGTGYDLVGTNKADPASLNRAFELALRLISHTAH